MNAASAIRLPRPVAFAAYHSKPSALFCTLLSHAQCRPKRAALVCQASGRVRFSNYPAASGSCTFQIFDGTGSGSGRPQKYTLKARLQSYGLAGVASYGLLNTVYYITAFIFFWTHVVKVPKGLGLAEAAKRFVGVMSLTWAGSQVTKVARIAAAIALAPFLDAACSRARQQLGLKSQHTALSLVVASCLGLTILCFGGIVLFWA